VEGRIPEWRGGYLGGGEGARVEGKVVEWKGEGSS